MLDRVSVSSVFQCIQVSSFCVNFNKTISSRQPPITVEVSPRSMMATTPDMQLEERSHSLPLNLRRLTTANLQQLAHALRLPTTASHDDTHQMIVGNLEEMGKEPRNIQVEIQKEQDGDRVLIRLRDTEGDFLSAYPVPVEERRRDVTWDPILTATQHDAEKDDNEEEDDPVDPRDAEIQQLKEQLEQETLANSELRKELAVLAESVDEGREKVKSLWRVSCQQLEDHDKALTEKDEEIAALNARIESSSQQCIDHRLPLTPCDKRPHPHSQT